MTIARWPRLSRATVTPRPTAVPADPKPWLHRRSVRNAPAPTALRVEPWDSEILRTIGDNACKDCGHVRCSCPEQAIERDVPMAQHMTEAIARDTAERIMRARTEPAPNAGEREVKRVGDTWAGFSGCHYKIHAIGGELIDGECMFVPGHYNGERYVGQRCRGVLVVDRISRAQPDAVDDGAVRIGDSFVLHELPEPWTVTRLDGRLAWGTRPGGDRETNVGIAMLRAMVDSFGKPIKRIARGPVPT